MAASRRMTKQRTIVAEALGAASRAVSAQELHERLAAGRLRIGLATVYRALEAEVAEGTASRVERSGHVNAYVACVPQHHHHLVCSRCQRVEDLSEAAFTPLLRAVRRQHGFQVDHATLDLYGLCAICLGSTRPRAGARAKPLSTAAEQQLLKVGQIGARARKEEETDD